MLKRAWRADGRPSEIAYLAPVFLPVLPILLRAGDSMLPGGMFLSSLGGDIIAAPRRGPARPLCDYCRDDVGREKPNVRPIVNCQSGAARLMPCRTPASKNTFFSVGCQMT